MGLNIEFAPNFGITTVRYYCNVTAQSLFLSSQTEIRNQEKMSTNIPKELEFLRV